MTTSEATADGADDTGLLFGHPAGLFTLFFAEMWERFSYYGMRALLIFYMIKGFLAYNDGEAYAVYGAYTALVYMTPYIGGMLADRLLGYRRAVIMGGLLMAAGHLLMTIETETAFFGALALLIVGNGFFKPNISTMVGGLYKKPDKKDAGFTLFYMGINLGAAMSPILCGYVGETYGWHYGFGLATAGMLMGVAIFVAPTKVTQLLILGAAVVAAVGMPFLQDSMLQLVVRVFLSAALLTAGVVAFVALGRGGIPKSIGAPPDPAALRQKLFGFLRADHAVYLGVLISVPMFALIVQRNAIARWALIFTGAIALAYILYEAIWRSTIVERHRIFVALILIFFSLLFWAFFEQAGSSMSNFADRNIDRVLQSSKISQADVGKTITMRVQPRTSAEALSALPLLSQEQYGHKNLDPSIWVTIEKAIRLEEKRKDKLKPAALEKHIASVRFAGYPKLAKQFGDAYAAAKKNNPKLTPDDVKKLVADAEKEFLKSTKQTALVGITTMTAVGYLRSAAGRKGADEDLKSVKWKVDESNIGMGIGGSEIPASEFQAANAIFILFFGLLFSGLWGFLRARNWEPSTPIKFGLGLIQLGLGFVVLWYAAEHADTRGTVGMSWLLLGYLLHTTGELCLSPVGLSMITKLSPKRIVSTMMGAWFLATAFSNYLASVIAQFTSVSHGDGGQVIPAPIETVNLYGKVFGSIGAAAVISGVICCALSPLLSKWMHPNEPET